MTEDASLPILGYHFESDSITGDYWNDSEMSVDEFLGDIAEQTGTAPEVIGAYVDGADYEDRASMSRSSAPRVLGADLPEFDAPDAVAPAASSLPESSRTSQSEVDLPGALAVSAAAPRTWQPTSAEVQIRSMGSKLAIVSKYTWYGSNPFAAPHVMADKWGMEFQVDFYTTNKGARGDKLRPNLGTRPWCGVSDASYKNWAAASNRPFDWFGWVASGQNTVVAPGSIGLYGDYNDLSDPCEVSSIAVGAADPGRIPSTVASTQQLLITMYPNKGTDTTSKIGALVQPVSRDWCESHRNMPLTDCMGVTPGTYPGPGPASSRPVLGDWRNKRAPDLCWVSQNYGIDPPIIWNCNSGG